MRKLLVLMMALSVLQSCKKKDDDTPPGFCGTTNGNLVILKVDYLTHQFEGGKMFYLPNIVSDSIPIHTVYQSPGDFGNITLLFGPANDTVFDGGIIWMGKGDIHYPILQDAMAFPSGNTTVAAPNAALIQYINKQMYPVSIPSGTNVLWNAIKHLSITKQYMDANARVGLFLYTPSVGFGNPADWDYFWVLYQPGIVE